MRVGIILGILVVGGVLATLTGQVSHAASVVMQRNGETVVHTTDKGSGPETEPTHRFFSTGPDGSRSMSTPPPPEPENAETMPMLIAPEVRWHENTRNRPNRPDRLVRPVPPGPPWQGNRPLHPIQPVPPVPAPPAPVPPVVP